MNIIVQSAADQIPAQHTTFLQLKICQPKGAALGQPLGAETVSSSMVPTWGKDDATEDFGVWTSNGSEGDSNSQ